MSGDVQQPQISVPTGNNGPRTLNRWRRRLLVWAVLAVVLAGGGFVTWFYVLGPQPPEIAGLKNDLGAALDVAEARSEVRIWPFRASKWGHLGLVFAAYECNQEAIACFARAGQLDPWSPRWPYLQGLSEVGSDLDKALALLERSVHQDSTAATPRLLLAETLLKVGRTDEAEMHFQFVLQQDPENARALLGMGRVADDHDDLAASRDYLKRSISSAGQIRETHALLMSIYQRLGDRSQHIKERDLAMSLPGNVQWPDPYYRLEGAPLRGQKVVQNRASQLLAENQADKAVRLLKELPQTGDRAVRTNLLLGRAYMRLGDFDTAVNAYQDALRLKPDSIEVLFALGTTLEKHGDFATAADRFRKLLKLKPNDPTSHYHLGCCLEKLNQYTEAVAEYRAAINLRPAFAAAHRELGTLLHANGQDADAVAALEQACKLAPKDEEARRRLQVARERLSGSKDKEKKR